MRLSNHLLTRLFLLTTTCCCLLQVLAEGQSHVLTACNRLSRSSSPSPSPSLVVFLIDSSSSSSSSSSSLSPSDFRRQLTFLKDVSTRLPIAPDLIRVSVITYGDPGLPPRLQFPTHPHQNITQLRTALTSIHQTQAGSAEGHHHRWNPLGEAIRLADQSLLRGALDPGWSPWSVNRIMVIVASLLGPGDHLASAHGEALRARDGGVVMLGVGIKRSSSPSGVEKLEDLVGSVPFVVEDFADLAKIRDLTARKICEAVQDSGNLSRANGSRDSDPVNEQPAPSLPATLSSNSAFPALTKTPLENESGVDSVTEPLSSIATQFEKAGTSERTRSRIFSTLLPSRSGMFTAGKHFSGRQHTDSTTRASTSAISSSDGVGNTDTVSNHSADSATIGNGTHDHKSVGSLGNKTDGNGNHGNIIQTLQQNSTHIDKAGKPHSLRHRHETVKRHMVGYDPDDDDGKRHKMTSDDFNAGASDVTQDYPRLRHEISSGSRGYWRMDENGKPVWFQEVRPGVYVKDPIALSGHPSRPLTPMGPTDRQQRRRERTRGSPNGGQTFGALVLDGTLERNRGSSHGPDLVRSTGSRSGPREALTARNLTTSCQPQPKLTGFYRFSDSGRLVWRNISSKQTPSRPTSTNCKPSSEDLKMVAAANMLHSKPLETKTSTPKRSKGQTSKDGKMLFGIPALGTGPQLNPSRSGDDRLGSGCQLLHHATDSGDNKDNTVTLRALTSGFWRYDSLGRRIWVPRSSPKTTPVDHTTTTTTTTTTQNTIQNLNSSYGFWSYENGNRIWCEFVSPGLYRSVNATELLRTPNRVRLELPPPPGARSVTTNRTRESHEMRMTNQSSLSVKSRDDDKNTEAFEGKNVLPHHNHSNHDHVPGFHRNLTKDSKVGQPSKINKLAGTIRPKRLRPEALENSAGQPGGKPISSPRFLRGGESALKSTPTSSSNNEKNAKDFCSARRPLSVVFIVDPRRSSGGREVHTKRLWQLAYDIIRGLRMDDGQIRIRFVPEQQRVVNSTFGFGTGSGQTMIHVAEQKSVPQLIQSASALLLEDSGDPGRKRIRKVGIYVTDGPSGNTEELKRSMEKVWRGRRIELYGVGVGSELNRVELALIADSRRKGKHLFLLPEPDAIGMDEVAKQLTLALCGIRTAKTDDTTTVV